MVFGLIFPHRMNLRRAVMRRGALRTSTGSSQSRSRYSQTMLITILSHTILFVSSVMHHVPIPHSVYPVIPL